MTNKLIEAQSDLIEHNDGLTIQRVQEIPQWWVDQLKDERFASKHRPTREYHRAASVPQAVVDQWLREGYDIFKEPIAKTLAKLKAEGLDAFITTDKQL